MAEIAPPRPLAEGDDRIGFDCGRESLNIWFRRHAWANHISGASRVTVLTDEATGAIAGYVTLSAAQIERSFLPKPQQRHQPDPLPVTLLGQLAVHRTYQGQGLSRSLLYYACRTALQAAASVGSIGIVTHPLDDRLRALYARRGFQDLPQDPRGAMIIRMADLRSSGFGP